MEHTAPAGAVTKSGENGTYEGVALDPGKYLERPGFAERMEQAGQDPAAMRRLLARQAAVA
jgi:hypothetical protein